MTHFFKSFAEPHDFDDNDDQHYSTKWLRSLRSWSWWWWRWWWWWWWWLIRALLPAITMVGQQSATAESITVQRRKRDECIYVCVFVCVIIIIILILLYMCVIIPLVSLRSKVHKKTIILNLRRQNNLRFFSEVLKDCLHPLMSQHHILDCSLGQVAR